MRLIDASIGLFMSKEGVMCLKTEYIADWGVEAYIVSSGEIFWGGAKTAEERNNLEVMPVDVMPVVHGRWVNEQMIVGGFAETWACDCSVCGRTQREPLWKPNYCPNCGARMDGELYDN